MLEVHFRTILISIPGIYPKSFLWTIDYGNHYGYIMMFMTH